MDNKVDWEVFFRYYICWIVYYVLMVEFYNVDVFCVGVEFVQVMFIEFDVWWEVIRIVWVVYSGCLIYVVNWGLEFEELVFWDEFDLIGLNCYYLLSEVKQLLEVELFECFEQVF